MNTSQPLDEHSEQVSPKRLRSLYEKAPPTSFNPVDAAILNNLGVDCFENGGIPDASKCFRNAMRIFAPELPQSLCREALNFKSFPSPCTQTMTRQVSIDSIEVSVDDQDSPQARGQPALPLSPSAPPAVLALGSSSVATRTEYDEGMNSFNRPLRIDSSHECSSHYEYQRTAPVLLFNIGQLHVLSGDDTTAAKYFRYALDIINQRSTSASCIPSCPATPIQPLTIEPHSSSLAEPMDAIPILHNLGHIYYRAQNYKLAMGIYSEALVIAQQPHNNDNLPASASTLNCLGVIFFHMSRDSDENTTKALNMLNTSLNIRKKILTYDDQTSADESRREIATAMNNVGRVHYMLGDHMAALQTYVEAYELRKELLPANHLDLAASAYNLGQTHHQLGNLDDAMTLYTEFYEAVSKYLGSSHRDVAIILKCMAQVHHDKSQYEEAAKLYYKSLTTTKAALGELHPEVASTLNKIGNMFYENSDFDAAIKVYKEGLAVERAVLQSDHQNIVVTLTNIAQSHKHRGNHTAALEQYTEAYNLQRTLLGPTHPKVAVTLSNVAQVSCRLGQFSRALDAYQEVLQIRRDAHGDNHVDVAATLNSIGLVLFRQGYHSLAIDSFEESLRVRRLCLGDQRRDVAVVLYNVATTHLEQGDEDKAMSYYAETLRVQRSTLGNDHPDLVVTLQHIGQVFRQRGELDTALEYFTEVLRIEKIHHGTSSPIVARLLNKMGNIYLQKADVPNMMECFAEATRIFEVSPLSSPSSDIVHREESDNGELKITGYNFYSLSIFHPECAAAA